MARRINEPITVQTRRQQPTAVTWRGVTYRVRVIGSLEAGHPLVGGGLHR